MSQYVTDTHALLWHIIGSRRLSAKARAVFTDADAGLHRVFIPSIVLVEAVYLAERKRIAPNALERLLLLLDTAADNYEVVPLNLEVVKTLRAVDDAKVPEMPDRIIVATAKHLDVELLTRDSAITTSGIVSVVW